MIFIMSKNFKAYLAVIFVLALCSTAFSAEMDVYDAAYQGKISFVRNKLKLDPGLINRPSGAEVGTLLTAAIKGGKVGMVKFLLKQGADPNFLNKAEHGTTALIYAIRSGTMKQRIANTRLLIQYGADVNKPMTAHKFPPIVISTWNGDRGLKIVKMLVESGAQVNRKTSDGSTAYHYALAKQESQGGHAQIVKYLKSVGGVCYHRK